MENKNQAPAQPTPAHTAPETSGGINLLPEVAEREIKAGVYKRKVNIVALGVLGLVGIVIVGILIFLTLDVLLDQ